MKLCNDGHDAIVYAVAYCPLCDAMDERKEALDELKELRADIMKLDTGEKK